jgi:hypothetical protein
MRAGLALNPPVRQQRPSTTAARRCRQSSGIAERAGIAAAPARTNPDLHPERVDSPIYPYLTLEQKKNNVPSLFMEGCMVRAVVEEAAALASLALFLGMVAIWAQVLGAL